MAKVAECSQDILVEGKELNQGDGTPLIINTNLLEISNDGIWLYFMPLFGPGLRRIETKHLRDPLLSDDQLATHIEDYARVPPYAGIAINNGGDLYFSSFTESAICKLDKSLNWQTVVSDPRISYPNEGEVGQDGFMYFPASRARRWFL